MSTEDRLRAARDTIRQLQSEREDLRRQIEQYDGELKLFRKKEQADMESRLASRIPIGSVVRCGGREMIILGYTGPGRAFGKPFIDAYQYLCSHMAGGDQAVAAIIQLIWHLRNASTEFIVPSPSEASAAPTEFIVPSPSEASARTP